MLLVTYSHLLIIIAGTVQEWTEVNSVQEQQIAPKYRLNVPGQGQQATAYLFANTSDTACFPMAAQMLLYNRWWHNLG